MSREDESKSASGLLWILSKDSKPNLVKAKCTQVPELWAAKEIIALRKKVVELEGQGVWLGSQAVE